MPITVGVVQETFPGERRVALAPSALATLKKAALDLLVQNGAGLAAGFADDAYAEAGAVLLAARDEVFARADIIVQVRALGANPDRWSNDLALMREDQTLIALLEPLAAPDPVRAAAERRINAFALELIPRTTRAQAMDVLSSQANLAGYKAVLLAAEALPKIFPMMMTAAGTITPARVFVIGAGAADSAPSPAPTTFARPCANRSKASAPASSNCPFKRMMPKTQAAMPVPWTKTSTAVKPNCSAS